MMAPTDTLANKLLDEEEGKSSPTVYYVAGLAHVGRGVCIDPRVPGAGLCDAALATQDAFSLQKAQALAAAIPGFAACNQVRQAVVISMCYQMGDLAGWPGFKAALAARDYARASAEMLYENPPDPKWSAWHTQTTDRCEREADMMRLGTWMPYRGAATQDAPKS